MPRPASARNREALQLHEDLFESMKKAVKPPTLPDPVTFAESEHFCNKKLFPRQRTLLRLFYADVEHMTDYDYEVIDGWRNNFYVGSERIGCSTDIWERMKWLKDNGYPHFHEIEFIGGRRGGKGHLGGIIGAYQAFKMITLDNPQWFYGIDLTKDLYCFITATNQSQARDYQFKDIAETISGARCFERWISTNKSLQLTLRTPADIRRIAEFERRRVVMDREVASIRFVALSSNSRAGRGAATFSLFFDEMAHMLTGTEGPQTAEEVYKALTPSLGQIGKDALIYIPTSPYTKVGKAYSIYEDSLSTDDDGNPANPDTLMVQLRSDSPYEDWDDPKIVRIGKDIGIDYREAFRTAPMVLDEAALREEKKDPESFRVEWRSQWAEVINAYLNPKIVDKMFDPIALLDGGERRLENYTPGVMRWVYRGHADPSSSQANFAMAIGHTEVFRQLEEWLDEEGNAQSEEVEYHHVIFDWLHVWKPEDYPDHQLDYMEVERELVDTIFKFRTLKSFSYDQYGGFVTVPYLKSHLKKGKHDARVAQATFTEKSNHIRAERFKSALGMGWVHAPRDALFGDGNSLLENELKFLQTKSGRVVRQTIGPVITKDLADCVMEVTSELLADQIDRYERNSRLSNTRLAAGAIGGYHTGMEPPPTGGSRGRDQLSGYARQAGSRKSYGVRRT